jgi:hypothetical protein
MKRTLQLILSPLFIAAIRCTAFGYGDEGHQTVGAIADKLLVNSPNTVAHIRSLIGNQSLERAATWADDVKYHFDPNNPEMVAFANANPNMPHNSGPHDHHAYHYTDIPIQENHYRAGSHGASKIDVVHMISNCTAILSGHSTSRNNPTNIPPKTALKLLVHYVGDIHQPLHVGAAYFGPNATLVNPNITPGAQEDIGGNAVTFHSTKLHSYWDTPAVHNAMAAAGVSTPRAFASFIIAHPPAGAQTSGSISGWPVKWANELLPFATEAHSRLVFRTAPHGWNAKAPNAAALADYDKSARETVTTEIGRAGFRLAALLQKIWP